ncbi:MAG: autotransporter outer membrane beta-barrel domain-containing protein, partial [Sutterellaceae bacterium]|nr:autotransporter outer membrane beta-barrel domain-containing protein [Sutterellaceae bacterium]
VNGLARQKLSMLNPDETHIWAAPLGGRTHRDAVGQTSEVHSTLYGALFGASFSPTTDWTIGGQIAVYERKDKADGAFEADSTGFELGAHAVWNSDTLTGLYAMGQVSLGFADTEHDRQTSLDGTLSSDWTEFGASVWAQTGWQFETEFGNIGPFVGLEYNSVHRPSIDESSTSAQALHVGGQTIDDVSAYLGLEFNRRTRSDTLDFALSAQAFWRHSFTDETIRTDAAMASYRSADVTSVIERQGADSIHLGASAQMQNKEGLSVTFSLSAEGNVHYNALLGSVFLQKRF